LLLEGKNTIIYGAGGGIGGGVARTFAREGANVFLVGRTAEPLEAVAEDISGADGTAEVAVLDALDERAVDEHARGVASKAGSVDASFNLISRGDVQGIPLVERRARVVRPRDRRRSRDECGGGEQRALARPLDAAGELARGAARAVRLGPDRRGAHAARVVHRHPRAR
jgi:NAD(P)-dependent dehydrogenase (short-subunit alcohol dehydrogenase family)